MRKAFGFYGIRQQSGTTDFTVKGTRGNRSGKVALLLVFRRCLAPQAHAPNDFADVYAHHRSRGIRHGKVLYKAASKLVGVIYSCLRSNQRYRYRGAHPQPQAASVTPNESKLGRLSEWNSGQATVAR